MQKKEFEKQVRDKMEELSFTPSAPVWQKVEERIRQKKVRRRALLWMLPLLLLFAGGGWWMLSRPDASRPQAAVQAPASAAESTPSGSPRGTLPGTDIPTKNGEAPGSVPSATAIAPASPSRTTDRPRMEGRKGSVRAGASSGTITATRIRRNQPASVPAATREEPSGSMSTADEKEGASGQTAAVPLSKAPLPGKGEPATDTGRWVPAEVNGPESEARAVNPVALFPFPGQPQTITDSLIAREVQLNPVVPAIPVNAAKPYWVWGLTAGAGTLQPVSGLQLFSGVEKAMDYSLAPNLYTGNGPIAVYRPNASPIEKGFSFSAGVSLKRVSGRRGGLVTGLRYSYFSTRRIVGQVLSPDSVRNNPALESRGFQAATLFQSADPAMGAYKYYTSQYHMLELPVGYEVQLLKRNPLYLQGGLTLTGLLGSNAVHYGNGVYFRDNTLLRKAGIHVFSDLTYTFWNHRQFTLQAGPRVQYGLSSLHRPGGSDRHNLLVTGFTTRVYLNK